jgi:hypothetical protein
MIMLFKPVQAAKTPLERAFLINMGQFVRRNGYTPAVQV